MTFQTITFNKPVNALPHAQGQKPLTPYESAIQPVSFGGINGSLYKAAQKTVGVIEWVDQSPIRQLLLAGTMGMTMPRVVLEWWERGRDMVLETIFRELTGDFSMVFLSGLMGSLVAGVASTKLMQKWIGKSYDEIDFNWRKHQVNANSMETLGNLFVDELNKGAKESKTVGEVKRSFIRNVLDRLRLASRDNAPHVLNGLDQELDAYAKNHSNYTDIRARDFKDILSDGKLSSRLNNQVVQEILTAHPEPKEAELALRKILKSFLTAHAIQEHNTQILVNALRKNRDRNQWEKILTRFLENSDDQRLQNMINQLESTPQKQWKGLIPQLFTEQELSILDTRDIEKLGKRVPLDRIPIDMIQSISADGKQVIYSHKTGAQAVTLKELLQEAQIMMHQFFEPVLGKHGLSDETARVTEDAAKQVQEYLTGPADQKMTWLKRLIPRKSKGLLNYMMSAKTWLMVVPVTLALVITISEAFINNWLTKRRHGGKVFSPYLGGPIEYSGLTSMLNSVVFRRPLPHTSPHQAFNDFLHPRRSMWMQSGQVAAHNGYQRYNTAQRGIR